MPGKIEGVVVSINDEGNLVTDISAEQLADAPRDETVTIACDGHETNGIFPLEHQEPPSTLLALIGAEDKLELAIVGDNLSQMLGIGVGVQVVVIW